MGKPVSHQPALGAGLAGLFMSALSVPIRSSTLLMLQPAIQPENGEQMGTERLDGRYAPEALLGIALTEGLHGDNTGPFEIAHGPLGSTDAQFCQVGQSCEGQSTNRTVGFGNTHLQGCQIRVMDDGAQQDQAGLSPFGALLAIRLIRSIEARQGLFRVVVIIHD